MSGATGAGTSAGTSAGTAGSEKDGGGRGSAAGGLPPEGAVAGAGVSGRGGSAAPAGAGASGPSGASASSASSAGDPRDPQTTQLKAIKDEPAGASKGAGAGAGAGASSPLPGERRPQGQQSAPYHPPQAYDGPVEPVRQPRTGTRTTPRVRKARLRVSKADPWSVMKVSFLLSIALGICTVVAAAVLWMVMDAMGVFSSVGSTISEATGSNESNGFDLQSFLSLPHVLMFSTIIAVIDVVLATALATLGAFIYNLAAGFVGGVELTLAEDE